MAKTNKKPLKLSKTELLELNLIHTQRQLLASQTEKMEMGYNAKQSELLSAVGKRLGIKANDFQFRLDTGEISPKPKE